MNNKVYFYAWALSDGKKGITDNWIDCYNRIAGKKGAKNKRFLARELAQKWLDSGADYKTKVFYDEDGVYFDSGTGGGGGVKIRVTDKNGKDLVKNIAVGKHNTNNFGELKACYYALDYALKKGIKKVFGDSRLVIDFWSKGIARIDDPETLALIAQAAKLRIKFEQQGGKLKLISGGANPADLGFHK
ncbi:MAG: viroplasmin family protein [Elusimicrobiota bacterium]|jgi:ribonuclease HI|nr:viroplasmin family protein [Elusimicrobiota bacterium]